MSERVASTSSDRAEAVTVETVSRHILADGGESWKGWLFELVDEFRRHPTRDLIAAPPPERLSARLRCLFASTVEALCAEQGWPAPAWCATVGRLADPWFVAEVENLKASALVESPAFFRQRNIFVLANFLSRA